MRYVSTRDNSKEYSFEDVFIKGLADDGGLYVPTSLKKFSSDELLKLKNLNYNDLSTEIINQFSSDFISKDDLSSLIKKSYSTFREKEVVKISNIGDLKLLELFHGPTLAFKDVAMQFIGNLYEYYLSKNDKKINIVVATSGDTGAAAIDAIKGKSNLNIFVLHPNNRISPVQRKLMTTVEEKIVKVIAGKFEYAEGPVKKHNVEPIYFDVELNKDKEFNFDLPSTHNSFIYLIEGEIKIGDKQHQKVENSKLILLEKGDKLKVYGSTDAKFLLIAGKPIGEQIARGGPFVMNTKQEILQAVEDYHKGTFVK